ncbi:nucleotide pyrophosphatase [bacterium (Candidatus Gribaldobacteria) CG_4_10_14_0_2_um_filter_41_16]|uniref:Nucleotide pyrophosphatase n=3 Tax=Candidatus Gribaldobacteria TaxID=2798536 RepID=A0A2M7VIX3_9BACT|nr:MAG: nucleotide pyrophosphatase [bacterium (Candidatus Gribaldobacteria) CG10_big_fil_rev_8_21_14_0_10_41_12]PIV46733.1 MAG: nucleotide pyrophosphatase [bacterium (Candidatus Gribaldobacteria) CG02_land_8_20_14_3_00_41_15]PJA01798.1 MAG: nucleotide pyrophosphatase [bacterium (Candidatus Gribaldobacteria) CG_4_10_14_0_2_um_filter_41_16]
MMKLIALGLDGAGFNLLQPWLDQGLLPNLAALQKKGVSCPLTVCLPPVTSPNWKCFSTGKNPGKLGVFWWENIDTENQKITVPASSDFHGQEIWDILGNNGYKVGVLNMPTCYPPRAVNGFMVAGGPDALESGFAWPKDLEKELKEKYQWRVLPKSINFLTENNQPAIEEIYNLIAKRFMVAIELSKKYQLDFLELTVYLVNVLRHHLPEGEKILRAWQIIDQGIGQMIKEFPQASWLIFSDHGSGEIKVKFNINQWLKNEGYLVLKNNQKDFQKSFWLKMGLHQGNLSKIAARLGLKDFLKKHFARFKFVVPSASGAVGKTAKEALIDWQKSQAVASGQGPIYLNKLQITNNKSQNLREEIIKKLERLEYNGVKIAKKVYQKEEIYAGEFMAKAPDLVIDQGEGAHISGGLGFKDIFSAPQKWLGENQKTGIFLAVGPCFTANHLSSASILDIAPTILRIFGLKKSNDLDGRVLNEIIK